MLNARIVNGGRDSIFSRQKARFSANSPENVRFKNPVKYNLTAGINDKGCNDRSILEAWAFEVAKQKQTLSALKTSVRRFLLDSLLKGQGRQIRKAAAKFGGSEVNEWLTSGRRRERR
jgi:hypothetical protein